MCSNVQLLLPFFNARSRLFIDVLIIANHLEIAIRSQNAMLKQDFFGALKAVGGGGAESSGGGSGDFWPVALCSSRVLAGTLL